MHPTLKFINFKRSIMKFFRDSLEVGEGLTIYFNKWVPELQRNSETAGKWISINISNVHIDRIASADLTIIIRTVDDPEGFESARIYDKIMKYLTSEESDVQVIDLYDTDQNPWSQIGGIRITLLPGDMGVEEIDYTDISVINAKAKWGAKI